MGSIEPQPDGRFLITMHVLGKRGLRAKDTFSYDGKRYRITAATSFYNGTLQYLVDTKEI